MKVWSKKRRIRWSQVETWRKAFKTKVGRCELCLMPSTADHLDIDEIARGPCRQLALSAPFAILVVHRHCHSLIQGWSRQRRLALLMIARPEDYDLEAFWDLTKRKFPEQTDVDKAASLILDMRDAEETRPHWPEIWPPFRP